MRLPNLFSRIGIRLALPAWLCFLPAHALYTREPIRAYRVADNAFTIDGRPDSLWRSVFVMQSGNQSLSFQDYSKMIILQPEQATNDDPSKYVPNPSPGSATLMAAYDSKALYFFFLVKTGANANPAALGCGPTDLWKADAAEIYLDPSAWTASAEENRTYFYPDASGLIFGTSPRTIQLDRPISGRDTRNFYRNRSVGERFQVRDNLPAGMTVAVSPRTSADTTWVGVEMRIPFWTAASDFAPGASMFVSWGFNRYGDSVRTGCGDSPVAYRWAKNIVSYETAVETPPGWQPGDSTHYDPSHSWDGWGQLSLLDRNVFNQCGGPDSKAAFDTTWDAAYWGSKCSPPPTKAARPNPIIRSGPVGSSKARPRDARGRVGQRKPSPSYTLPR